MKQPKRLDFKNDRNGQALFEKAQKKYITFLKSENKQLRLYGVSQQRELFVKEQGRWLMKNTCLEVEKIVDFEQYFINK
jgi:hypothetical protein